MTRTVDLVIPVKALSEAKTRLPAPASGPERDRHARLVLALVADTVAPALTAVPVRRVVVITPDDRVTNTVRELGADALDDTPARGLNAAAEHAERHLRALDPAVRVGALLADLPALRPRELSAVVFASRGARAYCPDRAGTGTTLLLSADGGYLDPRFGPDSAAAHLASGALPLTGPWPSVRCDVDTPSDLATATALGLGAATRAVLPGAALPGAPAVT